MRRKPLSILFFLGVVGNIWLAGCSMAVALNATPGVTIEPTSPPPTIPATATDGSSTVAPVGTLPALEFPAEPVYGYTYQQADGNRWVAGSGCLPESKPINLPLGRSPVWVVGVPANSGALWAVVLETGDVRAFYVREDGAVEEMAIQPEQWPVSGPPLLRWSETGLELVKPPAEDGSPLTHPVPLPDGRLVYVSQAGEVVIWENDGEMARLEVNTLPDARLVTDPAGRILLLTGATTRYAHGIAGDDLEAANITLIETSPVPRVVLNVELPEERVVEGLAPIWADLDGDGTREIIVTLSDSHFGAQIVVFNEQGQQVAAGPSVGQGFRWRHQIAVGPFAPDGSLSLAEVLTPHIGGVTGFYRWEGESLEIAATLTGYTSHVINTRNLDMAAAGDFDGDGRPEVLLPTQDRSALGGIRWEADGALTVWTLPLDGQLTTNIGAVTLSDGRISVAAGMDTGVLRIWGP